MPASCSLGSELINCWGKGARGSAVPRARRKSHILVHWFRSHGDLESLCQGLILLFCASKREPLMPPWIQKWCQNIKVVRFNCISAPQSQGARVVHFGVSGKPGKSDQWERRASQAKELLHCSALIHRPWWPSLSESLCHGSTACFKSYNND